MPSNQLFVDSDGENEDFDDDESGGSDNEEENFGNGSVNGNSGDGEEGGEEVSNGEQKGKKRKKGVKTRNEARRMKKLKKLGPKQVKGGKKEETLTKEEVKELSEKEYEQYFNLYNVQLEEVLKECSVSEGTQQIVQDWVEEFTGFIQKQKRSKPFTVEEFPRILKGVQLPLPKNIWSTDGGDATALQWMKDQTIQWKPPVSVQIRGSWGMGTQLEKISAVDLFLEMPEDFLHKSDFLNHKYHVKRAIYLGIVAKKLMERGGCMVNFTLANGDPLKPVVSVEIEDIAILIRAVPPQSFFRLSKLACDKNNLRYEHFFKKEKPKDDPETSTQHYNFTILEDSLAVEMNHSIQSFLCSHPKYQDAVKLIKVWLAQRGLLESYGGFSGFIVAQFVHYLFHMNRIKSSMSSLQLLRMFFVNLIHEDLTERGIGFCAESDSIKFAQLQWDVVFLDQTGLVNFTANMSKLTYKRIQEDARQAIAIIDKRNITGFLSLFTTKVKFLMNFDHVFRFAARRLENSFKKKSEHEIALLDHSGFIYPVAASTLGNLIEKCLGRRITILDCQLPPTPLWPVSTPMPSYFPSFIHFGLNINREASQKIIEKCESDAEIDVQQFKEFWGDKSELRRFKDGTLKECVSLENISHLGKSRLCFQMLHYILQRHLSYTMGENAYLDKQIEDLVESKYLKLKPAAITDQVDAKGNKNMKQGKKIYLKGKLARRVMKKLTPSTPEEKEFFSVDDITRNVSNTFDELSKILRQLEELPLQISTVQGTSAVLRFSHIQPTPPQTYFINKKLTEQHPKRKALLIKKGDVKKSVEENGANEELGEDDEEIKVVQEIPVTTSQSLVSKKLPKYVEPVGVIIHLETSGQWPDNMKAIERLKCAFLIKIGELLQAKFGLTVQPYARYLDVLKDGFVFRIKITYFRELTLLRQLRGADGVLRTRENQESLRMEREALILPQLTSTLHSFHLQYEAFGKTCRLAKRWIASQLLLASPWEYNRNLEEPDCRITEECVELLVAYLFLNYAPHLSFPSEAQVGFQRFLYFLAKTDFHAVPIIINFNEKWTADEIAAIELEFVKMRPTLPCLFIATPFDPKGSVWTKNLLIVLLKRAKRLAEVALTIMESQFDSERVIQNYSSLKVIFSPVTRDLDVLIRLKPKMNPRANQSVESLGNPLVFKPYKKKAEDVIPITDFDPTQMYLQDLRDSFGHLAVFLHDTYGGNVIAVKWKPDIFKPVAFTTASVKGRYMSRTETNTLTTNINGILESFEVMGYGLVENIETFPDRWEIGN